MKYMSQKCTTTTLNYSIPVKFIEQKKKNNRYDNNIIT